MKHAPLIVLSLCFLLLTNSGPSRAEDNREMVELPAMMQEHMLANMRDHLAAIDEILAALARNNGSEAANIAETRLGLTSLESHGARHMARFMPEPMRALGTEMHRAASRFAEQAQTSDIEPSVETQRYLFKGLGEVTTACVGCHQAYRIR